MLLRALMLHQDSSDERKKKRGNGPKQSSGARCQPELRGAGGVFRAATLHPNLG